VGRLPFAYVVLALIVLIVVLLVLLIAGVVMK
jgi:hypothetical protein